MEGYLNNRRGLVLRVLESSWARGGLRQSQEHVLEEERCKEAGQGLLEAEGGVPGGEGVMPSGSV